MRLNPAITQLPRKPLMTRISRTVPPTLRSQSQTSLFLLVLSFAGVALASRPVTAATSRYFLKHPDPGLYYLNERTAKTKKVSCVVEHGVEVNIVCNDNPVPPTQLVIRNDSNGVEVSVTIGKNYVKEFGTRITCRCIATKLGSDDPFVYNSRKVRIVQPFLDKDFALNPESKDVSRGATVRFRCEPPPGDPKPNVFWMYKPFNSSSSLKRIMANAGRYSRFQKTDLLIRNVQLSDSGFYICSARNQASYRFSRRASLNVYDRMRGNWSEWSEWSVCSSGSSFRIRNCQTVPESKCRGPRMSTRVCLTTPTPTAEAVIGRGIRVGRQGVRPTTPSASSLKRQSSNHMFVLTVTIFNLFLIYNY